MRLVLGDRTVDLDARSVTSPRGPVASLSPNEVRLLRRLIEADGEPVPADALRQEVDAASDNAFHRAVVRLRGKLEVDPKAPSWLVTVRGSGVALVRPRPTAPVAGADRLDRPALRSRLDLALTEPGPVTLLGPGGVGKTTLALDAVARRPGALFCDLVPARSADDVWRIVAGTAAEPVPSDPAGARGLARALARRTVPLLVLDNAEQVVGGVADAAELLVSEAPELRVLATSRVPLGLRRERRLEIPLLDPGEALALFRMRAASAVDDPALEDVLGRVDRLPLMIELLATYARAMSPRQVLDGLAAGALLDLPTAPHVADRHHTLGRMLRWSWDLLGPADQRALARLSLWAGSFPAEAAAALIGPDPFDRLQTLIEAGLVRARDRRLSLLEVVRRFAADRLAEGADRPEVLRAGLDWAIGYSTRRPPESRYAASARVAQELDLLWGVFDDAEQAALPVGPLAAGLLLISAQLPTRQRLRLGGAAIRSAPDDAAKAEALIERGIALRYSGDQAAALADLDQAVGLGPSLARPLLERATARRQLGDEAGAEADLRAALVLAPGDAQVQYRLASHLAYHGRLGEAAELMDRALADGEPHVDQALAMRTLRASARSRVDPEGTLAAYDALLAQARAAGVPNRAAFLQGYRADVLTAVGRWDEADAALLEAEARLAALGFAVPLAEFRCRIAWLRVLRGDLDGGRSLFAAIRAGADGYIARAAWGWSALAEAAWGDPGVARAAIAAATGDRTPNEIRRMVDAAEALLAEAAGDPQPWARILAEAESTDWLLLPGGLPRAR